MVIFSISVNSLALFIILSINLVKVKCERDIETSRFFYYSFIEGVGKVEVICIFFMRGMDK